MSGSKEIHNKRKRKFSNDISAPKMKAAIHREHAQLEITDLNLR